MRYLTRRSGASLAALLAATAAQAQAPAVMTEIPVTHALVAQVMGDLGTPDLLLDRGADPHHFQLRPSQARALAQADLVVWVGPDLTPWMARTTDTLSNARVLELLEVEGTHLQPYAEARLMGAVDGAHDEHGHDDDDHGHSHDDHAHGDDDHGHSHDDHAHGDDDHGHGHDDHAHGDDDHGHGHDDHAHGDDDHGHGHDDHAHGDDDHGHGHDDHAHGDDDHGHGHDDHAHGDDDHGHGHDDHAHGDDDHGHGHDDHAHDHSHGHSHDHDHSGTDPHAWLNPDNAQTWLGAIATELAALDPENAATYQANAEAAQASIASLKEEIETILAPAVDTGIVVYHDAYGYFAESFGLNILGSVTLGDAATPGAARLSTIRANLTQAGAECIFPEVNHPDAYVALVIEDSALRVGSPLDPAGTMLEPGPALYETLMRDMAQAIADCATGN